MNNILITPCGLRYKKQFFIDKRTKEKFKYIRLNKYKYYSKRYKKYCTVEILRSDGATGAFDIASCAWWVHDQLCKTGKWDDGTLLTNWQCSQVLSDILWSEKRYIRSQRWKYATFCLGGGEARKNGMFKLKDKTWEI